MTGTGPSASDPASGGLRRESDVEILDDKQAVRGPLTSLTGVRRYRRTLRVLGLLAVAALSAAYGAAATHRSDVHGSASDSRSKVSLQLVGGTGTLNTEPGSWASAVVAGILKFTVRNDGPLPVDIVTSAMHQPGIAVTRADGDITVTPGEQAVVIVDINVDCHDAQLPSQPDALHLTVRSKDGHVHPVSLPVAQIHQTPNAMQLEAAATVGNDQGSYFVLCGQAVNPASPAVAYLGLLTTATSADPAFSYHIAVTDNTTVPMILAPTGISLPGVETTPSLAQARRLVPGEWVDVTMAFRVVSCRVLGDYLASFQGTGPGLAAQVGGDEILSATLADKRFPSLPRSVVVMQDAQNGSNGFYPDFIKQVVAACPALR